MTAIFTRVLILAFALWLPLQAGLVAAMPVCGAGKADAAGAAAHAQAPSGHGAHHAGGNTDPGDAPGECHQCDLCHARCMGALPLAEARWAGAGADADVPVAPARRVGLIATLIDRPPLTYAG